MAKKRTLNLVEFIIQSLLLILLAVMDFVTITRHEWTTPNIFIPLRSFTFFEYYSLVNQYFWAYAFIALMLTNAIICFVSCVSKSKHRNGVIHTALSIINLLIGLSFFVSPVSEMGYEMNVNPPLKYMGILLLFAMVVLAFIKRSHAVVPPQKTTVVNNIKTEKSSAEELSKYKKLLEEGVITQEEFDSKKKQLLNL